jgi:hypothetical protein
MLDLYVPEGTMPEDCSHPVLYSGQARGLATEPPRLVATRALTPIVRNISLRETLGPMNKCPWLVRLMTRAALTGRTVVQFCFPGVTGDSGKDFGDNVRGVLHCNGRILMNLLAVRWSRPR